MFGDRLKREREKRGWSQEELARRLNISKSAVGMYERNERQPAFALTQRLAELFGVTLDYLIGRASQGALPGGRQAPGDEDEPPLTPEELDAIERIKRDPEMGVAFQDFLKAPIRKQRSMLRALQILGEMDEK